MTMLFFGVSRLLVSRLYYLRLAFLLCTISIFLG